jgi:hypothetical protein
MTKLLPSPALSLSGALPALLLAACSGDAQPVPASSSGEASPPAPIAATEQPRDAGSAPVANTQDATAPLASHEYETEKTWAETHGVTIEAGKVTVLAKRFGADKRSVAYEDTFIVFKANSTVARFVGTTKPAQMPRVDSDVVPDVDSDGRKDLGIVRPGKYVAHGSITYGVTGYERAAFKVKATDGDTYLPAWRDLSGDGIFSANEKSLAAQRDYKISGIYIHYGFETGGTVLGTRRYEGPWSVGCQNIKYLELDAFVAAVGGADATFPFAIVDAD